MLKLEQLNEISEVIKNDYSREAKDFVDAFEWLNLAVDGVLSSVRNQLADIHKSTDYEKIIELAEFSSKLSQIQKYLTAYSLKFISSEDEDKELEDEEELEYEKKSVPNYSEYTVDNQIPHNLFEDYKFTKACAFSFRGKVYESKNMRDVLVQTCSILADINIEKLNSFLDDPAMKGRKVSYFGTKSVIEENINKNEKIPETDLYVWVNLSCNQIRNILRKMLRKYDISFSEFQIYLRADYSDLHPEKTIVDNQPPEGSEKIGKHVNNSMRSLVDSNYSFSNNDLTAMQSAQWSKEQLGIYEPLIKKYDENIDITAQIIINSCPRYWKDIFIFNNRKFFVTSQWYERHRIAFDEWYNSLKYEDK